MARFNRENLPQGTTYEEARLIVAQKFIDNPNLRSVDICIDKDTRNLSIYTTEYKDVEKLLKKPLTNQK